MYICVCVYCLRLSSCLQAGERSELVRICCRFSKEHSLLQESTLHSAHQTVLSTFPPRDPAENPGQASPWRDPGPAHGGFLPTRRPPLARCHGAIREPSSHQIYFLPLCGFPKRQIRGSATEKPFGIFIHVKTCTERGACLGSMPCRRLPFVSPNKSTAPVQRDPGIWINHGYQLGNSLWAQVQSVPDD